MKMEMSLEMLSFTVQDARKKLISVNVMSFWIIAIVLIGKNSPFSHISDVHLTIT
jgi:uncharacterized membrane protein